MLSNKDNNFLNISLGKWGLNLLIIGVSAVFIAFVIMVVIIVKCRSKGLKKKNSICEEEGGYVVDSGILSPNILNIKRTLSENSESSDDILYETDRRFVLDRVQPKRYSLRSQKSVSSVDSETEAVPSVVVSLIIEGNTISVTLIKAKNLRRSGYSSTDKLIPEGVLARLYPRTRSLSTDSSQTDGEPQQQQKSDSETDYYETTFVKSKKSKYIKFDEKETFRMSEDSFPLRISIYEMDKQKIRYNIGHSFLAINTRDNYQTNQIIELDLFSTIYKAKNSYLNKK